MPSQNKGLERIALGFVLVLVALANNFGFPYRILLDQDDDGVIQLGRDQYYGRSLAWSVGPNGLNEWGKGDDQFRAFYGKKE